MSQPFKEAEACKGEEIELPVNFDCDHACSKHHKELQRHSASIFNDFCMLWIRCLCPFCICDELGPPWVVSIHPFQPVLFFLPKKCTSFGTT